jgi:hypothetical protein
MLAVVLFIAALVAALLLNGPVGNPTVLEGTITQVCIPKGRSNNTFACTAGLSDGTTQIFISLTPLDPQAPVYFSRYDRRFVGSYYQFRRSAREP